MKIYFQRMAHRIKRSIRLARHYTFFSSFHTAFFSSGKLRHLKISSTWGFPIVLGFILLLWLRRDSITNDRIAISYVFLAATWSFIGPLFIWRYETKTVKEFWLSCRKIAVDRAEIRDARKLVHKTLLPRRFGIVFLITWSLLVCAAFNYSYPFVKGFGFFSRTDFWWLLGFFYVVVYSIFTGIGFLLVLQTLRLIRVLHSLRIVVDPYHPDGRGGLGFVGGLMTQTALMFASGALYIPILLRVHSSISQYASDLVPLLVALYAVAIGLSFATPVWFVHRKLEKEKKEMLQAVATKLSSHCQNSDLPMLVKYLWLRGNYADIKSMKTWPFDTENALTVISSIFLPILLTIIDHATK
jgi:hypothetical protein